MQAAARFWSDAGTALLYCLHVRLASPEEAHCAAPPRTPKSVAPQHGGKQHHQPLMQIRDDVPPTHGDVPLEALLWKGSPKDLRSPKRRKTGGLAADLSKQSDLRRLQEGAVPGDLGDSLAPNGLETPHGVANGSGFEEEAGAVRQLHDVRPWPRAVGQSPRGTDVLYDLAVPLTVPQGFGEAVAGAWRALELRPVPVHLLRIAGALAHGVDGITRFPGVEDKVVVAGEGSVGTLVSAPRGRCPGEDGTRKLERTAAAGGGGRPGRGTLAEFAPAVLSELEKLAGPWGTVGLGAQAMGALACLARAGRLFEVSLPALPSFCFSSEPFAFATSVLHTTSLFPNMCTFGTPAALLTCAHATAPSCKSTELGTIKSGTEERIPHTLTHPRSHPSAHPPPSSEACNKGRSPNIAAFLLLHKHKRARPSIASDTPTQAPLYTDLYRLGVFIHMHQ